ncbi:MAG: DUF1501 domain-containing protein [Pirellula sp.]
MCESQDPNAAHTHADSEPERESGCSSYRRWMRRDWLRGAGLGAAALQAGFLTRFAEHVAQGADPSTRTSTSRKSVGRPKSLIVLWLQGGPSQLETWDPHSGSIIGGDTQSIGTSLPGLSIAAMLPRCAEIMHQATLIRSMVSKEGDHERATYNMKTGWRPDPTLIHPSIGAVLCHQSESNLEIPRHISIQASQWAPRGGYLGSEWDAFKLQDPKDPLPNLKSYTDPTVFDQRISDLELVESQFRKGRRKDLDRAKTLHSVSTERARIMMSSEQIAAFEIQREPDSVQNAFGDTPFGRGCLAAVRLIEQGVTCVEIELNGWDTHIENHALQTGRCNILDAALHALIRQLEERELLDSTVVMCGGEFGRTPKINVAGGRDHWPTGFSSVLFGGPFRRGFVHGETLGEPLRDGQDPMEGVRSPVRVEDLHATVLDAFGVDFTKESITPIGRPMAVSAGTVIRELLQPA